MPRIGVSYDDVVESIHTLEKAGLKPSIRLIREKLGKGSLSTIAEHKRAYDIEVSHGPTETLPDPIAKGLLKGATEFWQELVEAAQDEIDAAQLRIEAEIAECQARERDLKTELAAAKDENGRLVAAIAERDQRVAALDGKLTEATETRQSIEKDALRLKEQLDASTAQANDKGRQLNALREDLQVSRKEREALDSHLEHQATDHARELATVMQKLAEEKTARQANAEGLVKASAAAEENSVSVKLARQQVLALEKVVTKLEKAITVANKTANAHEAQDKRSAAEIAGLKAETVATIHSNVAMIQEKDARIADLQAANQALERALKTGAKARSRKKAN